MATKAKSKNTVKAPKYKVPAGYHVCNSDGNTAGHDWDKNPVLEGKVIEIKEVTTTDKKTKKKKDTRLMVVQTKEGNEVAVWEKHQLKELFDNSEEGTKIYIYHTGLKNIGGGKSMHEFVTAYK